jgi:hypothetical protein
MISAIPASAAGNGGLERYPAYRVLEQQSCATTTTAATVTYIWRARTAVSTGAADGAKTECSRCHRTGDDSTESATAATAAVACIRSVVAIFAVPSDGTGTREPGLHSAMAASLSAIATYTGIYTGSVAPNAPVDETSPTAAAAGCAVVRVSAVLAVFGQAYGATQATKTATAATALSHSSAKRLRNCRLG